MKKRKAQLVHAKRRALERFGIELSRKSIERIVADIQAGRASFLRKQSGRVSLFEIELESCLMVVAYDKTRKSIVTCLLPEMIV
jgi:hypothetical protein